MELSGGIGIFRSDIGSVESCTLITTIWLVVGVLVGLDETGGVLLLRTVGTSVISVGVA